MEKRLEGASQGGGDVPEPGFSADPVAQGRDPGHGWVEADELMQDSGSGSGAADDEDRGFGDSHCGDVHRLYQGAYRDKSEELRRGGAVSSARWLTRSPFVSLVFTRFYFAL